MKSLLTLIGMLMFTLSMYAQYVYQAPTGNLSVTFPNEPVYASQDLEVEGMNVTMRTYSVTLDTAAFYVAEVTYPASFTADDVQSVLQRSAKGFFAEFDMDGGYPTKVYSSGIEGAEYSQMNDSYGISYRIFFYKNTLIQMAAMNYGGYLPDADLKLFFNSLNIKL